MSELLLDYQRKDKLLPPWMTRSSILIASASLGASTGLAIQSTKVSIATWTHAGAPWHPSMVTAAGKGLIVGLTAAALWNLATQQTLPIREDSRAGRNIKVIVHQGIVGAVFGTLITTVNLGVVRGHGRNKLWWILGGMGTGAAFTVAASVASHLDEWDVTKRPELKKGI